MDALSQPCRRVVSCHDWFWCRCNHCKFKVSVRVIAASQCVMAPTLREFLVKIGEGREDTCATSFWQDVVTELAMHVCARFIDEVVAILTENQVIGLRDLHQFKFEYVAWPDRVSGALWLALHVQVVGRCNFPLQV